MDERRPPGFRRTWDGVGSLSDEWNAVADDWIAWARDPHDSYWRFHRDRFIELLPPPPQHVIDLGCGEGRLTRDLTTLRYSVVAVDASPPMIAAARQADPTGRYEVADAGATGLPDASFDGVIAFMSLHDLEDLPGAIKESRRIVRSRGWLAMVVVHPLSTAGVFKTQAPDAEFCISGSYLDAHKYAEEGVSNEGLHMRFASRHRPFGCYFSALEQAGFTVDRLREVTVEPRSGEALREYEQRWRRLPLFLHLRAVAAH